jgi:hypothetical protein
MKENPGSTVIRFDRYSGRTIDQIAQSDRGLLYLDKLVGILPTSWKIVKQIRTYLSDPAIAKELDDLLLDN